MNELRYLMFNGVPLSLFESIDLSQDYDPEEATDSRRTASGALKTRTLWRGKIQTTISGRGLVPSGLSGFDFSLPYTLSCVEPRAINSQSNVITCEASRRSDTGSEPYALAFADGHWAAAEITDVSADQYTIELLDWAQVYQLRYFPEILVQSSAPSESFGSGTTPFGWNLTAREV